MNYIKKYSLFYVNLVWLIFPFYFAVLEKNTLLFGLTLFFGTVYVLSLYTDKNYLRKIYLSYMVFYIVFTVYIYSPMAILNCMYIIYLLLYKFEEIRSISTLSSFFYTAITLSLVFSYVKYNLEKEFIFALIFTVFLLLFYFSLRMYIIIDINKKEKQKQNEYINNMLAENERNRIGRDLHDTLGNVFATLTLKTELALNLLEKSKYEDLRTELQDLKLISQKTMKDVRDIVSSIKFRTISEELLNAKKILNLANISLEIKTNENLETIMPIMQSNISMVIRECVNNILKHSLATNCKIKITENKQEIVIEIEDDGVGFKNLKGTELYNIKDRLLLIKGDIKISNLKNPTKITVVIPYERGEYS